MDEHFLGTDLNN